MGTEYGNPVAWEMYTGGNGRGMQSHAEYKFYMP